MVILGVDPGFSMTGFAIMRKQDQKTSLLDYGAVPLSPKNSLSERIGTFFDFFSSKIETFQVQFIAIETPFLGKNAQNFLKLGYLRGIVYLLADRYKLSIMEFAPREIKMTITGYGAAQKDQVARVLMKLFRGLEMPKKLDVTDAVAVTLCGLWKCSSYENKTAIEDYLNKGRPT